MWNYHISLTHLYICWYIPSSTNAPTTVCSWKKCCFPFLPHKALCSAHSWLMWGKMFSGKTDRETHRDCPCTVRRKGPANYFFKSMFSSRVFMWDFALAFFSLGFFLLLFFFFKCVWPLQGQMTFAVGMLKDQMNGGWRLCWNVFVGGWLVLGNSEDSALELGACADVLASFRPHSPSPSRRVEDTVTESLPVCLWIL